MLWLFVRKKKVADGRLPGEQTRLREPGLSFKACWELVYVPASSQWLPPQRVAPGTGSGPRGHSASTRHVPPGEPAKPTAVYCLADFETAAFPGGLRAHVNTHFPCHKKSSFAAEGTRLMFH